MSNVNSFAGFYNLPAVVVTATSEQALLVPAAGVYPGLPSPVLVKSSGIVVAPPPDIAGGVLDGRPFRVRVAGIANTLGAASTIIYKLRQVNAASVGVIGAAGSVDSSGVPGTGSNLMFTSATIASSNVNDVQFAYEATLIWNSASKRLSGMSSLQFSNFTSTAVVTAPAAVTAVASLNFADLNFMASFTFSAANAGNSVTVQEFAIDRV